MSAAEEYKANGPTGGFRNFAFDLNQALVIAGEQESGDPVVRKAVAELDQCICHRAPEKEMVLFRGCALGPILLPACSEMATFWSYLSASCSLLVAARFLVTCQPGDGSRYLMKIIYPGSALHFSYGSSDEHEVLLPRKCKFDVSNWTPDQGEELLLRLAGVQSIDRLTFVKMRLAR